MGIDFLCAFSLYHTFSEGIHVFLFYNFSAFALQMPLGIILDYWCDRSGEKMFPGYVFLLAGVLLTVFGTITSPWILGLGNALFHTGGGVLSIHEDDRSSLKGRGLGVFVAPGAIGLFLGTLFHNTPLYTLIRILVSIVMATLTAVLFLLGREDREERGRVYTRKSILWISLFCFLVVILRSLTGMSVLFSWKATPLISFLAVLCLASGKALGGFLGASFGMKKTVIITLLLSAVSYYFGDNIYGGLVSLLLFNMTMPLTLYLLKKVMPEMPGFAFGILTFALFLGYLPVYYGFLRDIPPFPMGTISSLISLVFLCIAVVIAERDEKNG